MRRLPVWFTHWYTYRGAVGIVSGLAIALLMFGLYRIDFPGVHPEDRFFPEDSAPASDVVIVGIDDKSIAAPDPYGGHWPFTRDRFALALDQLSKAKAAAVAFDVGFSESYSDKNNGDQQFHDSLVRAAQAKVPVILSYGASKLSAGTHDIVMDPKAPDEIPIRSFRCADASNDEYAPCQQKIATLASTNIDADSDGVVRRMAMFVKPACAGRDSDCPADLNPLGFAGYQRYFLGDQADRVPLAWTPQGATFGSGWTSPLWVDGTGHADINYLGAPGTFPAHGQYVSFSDVASGNFDPSKVQGKVVLIGAYNATGLHDEHIVPVATGDAYMQGIEIHASFVSQLERQLQGSFLQPEPPALVLLVMLMLGVGLGWLVARLSLIKGALAVVGLLAAYTGFWIFGMEAMRTVPNIFHTWLVMGLAYTSVTAYRFLYEDREKRKVTTIFGQYLKPELVAKLASARTLEELTLGGERRDVSLLFVDIRGFTSMSETMTAEDVVKVATEYLNELTRVVFKWDGTIDKYVGDEIMAVWNAPHEQENHALLAIRCAYDMITRAPDLQARLIGMGLPPIRYGIGINTGPVVWGNLGSSMRRQFTALGDAVNTAARFCGVAGPFELLIGERTYEMAKDYIAVELAPDIQLKGKSAETFKIFKVVAIREDTDAPWVPFPTDMATQTTFQNVQIYRTRTQQTILAAGATVAADAVVQAPAPVALSEDGSPPSRS
ncbi:MAG TPA: adenylate/guanylate cyclase domain-containing protein [Candidatus Dormibacteraeota bacterium]